MTPTTIVLGCSRTRRANLAAIVEVLAGRGNPVEVVSGLDNTDEPWRDAIARLGMSAVYVLCTDEKVNLPRVSALRRLLTDAQIPSSQVSCGPIDWNQPTQVLRNVQQLLKPMVIPRGHTMIAPPSDTPGTLSPPSPRPSPRGHTMIAPPSETSGTFIPPSPRPSPRGHTMIAPPSETSGTFIPPSPRPSPRGHTMIAPPSETSGTFIPPSPPPARVAAEQPSARQSFVSGDTMNTFNWKPFAAVGGVALLALAAAVPLLTSDDAEASAETPVSVSAVVADEPEPEPEPEPELESEQNAPVAEPAEPELVEPEPAEADDAMVEADDAMVEAVNAAVTNAGEDVFEALASQEVRALDILLIGPEAHTVNGRGYKKPERLRFDAAEEYCHSLNAGGLDGWRLPTAGELASLSENKMLSKSVYWSSTKGDSFGDNRVVWSVYKKRMKPMRRNFKGARTVCVRHLEKK